jgi:uncharacterized membrane protein YkvA (DUF1232 family)
MCSVDGDQLRDIRGVLGRLRAWARGLKREVYAIALAQRDPLVPWYARVCAACVVAYAFSPIDLIPDPIPVLGYLDDLIIVPLGIALVVRLIPPAVLAEYRVEAERMMAEGKPRNWAGAAFIIICWLLVVALGVLLAFRLLR